MESTLEKIRLEPPPRLTSQQLATIKTERQVFGLAYGLVSGLAFVGLNWGLDAYLLSQASAVQPWGRLLFSLLLVLPIYAFSGWLAVRLDKPLVAALVWGVAGAWASSLALWLAIDGYQAFLAWRQPEMATLLQYPFSLARGSNMLLVGFFPALTSALAGLLAPNLVESAVRSSMLGRKLFLLCVCIPMIALGALAADQMVNAHLRKPLLAVDDILQVTAGLKAPTGLEPRLSQKSLLALDAEQPFLGQDYQLLVRDFDEEMVMVNILVLVGDRQLLCPVFDNSPGMCRPTATQ